LIVELDKIIGETAQNLANYCKMRR